MKVSEMIYKRADIDEYIVKFSAIIEKLKNAKSVDEYLSIREENNNLSKNLQTTCSLSFIRFSLNSKDEFYLQEKMYYDRNTPRLSAVSVAFSKAFLDSPFRKEAERVLNPLIFKMHECTVKSTDARIVEEQIKENELVTEYLQIMSEMLFDYNGEKIPLTLLKKHMSDKDRAVRKSAYEVAGLEFSKHGAAIEDIYDKLIKVRNQMARKLGYKNFTELGYYRLMRIGFSRRDVESFRENVKKEIVPIVSKLKEKIKKKLDIKEMKIYDIDAYFADGNADPILNAEEMFEAAKNMYHELDTDAGEFFDSMLESDAFDVISREGKWGGGYCTTLPDYNQPFILANFNGSSADVDVLTHEAGHAFADYMSYKAGLDYELGMGGMETAETHSMSMEFFCWKFMDKFFGKRSQDYKFAHLSDALTFIPYGCIVDNFQHIVYENENLSPSERNSIWMQLEKEYRPYMNCEGIPYYDKGTRWQYQMHIFEQPFYYIDYCLAQTNALQFLLLSVSDYQRAFDRYKSFLKRGGTKCFSELTCSAGLKSPFQKETLKNTYEKAEKLLDDIAK